MIPSVSIIIGFRNREFVRVKRSLDAISNQSYQEFELIFVDYGSDKDTGNQIRELVESYPFSRYVFSETQGWFWNRAHALNSGIRLAKGDLLLLFDIDLIIEDNFLQKITQLDYTKTYYTFSCFYLPRNFKFGNESLEISGTHHYQNYVGLCAVSREEVLGICGFDEYYMGWGGEDDDFYSRLTKSGLQRFQASAINYLVFHQWHKMESPAKPTLWYLTMVNYLYEGLSANQNRKEWGKIITKEDRKIGANPILEFESKAPIKLTNDFFAFNELIAQFYDAGQKDGYFRYMENFANKRRLPFSWWKNTEKTTEDSLNVKSVIEFLQYFIGINRNRILDYSVIIQPGTVQFYFIKKPVHISPSE